jgi:dTDP-4-dehydrorhamnose reductase
MRVAVTGAAGLFGHGLVQEFRKAHDVTPLTRADADITDHDAVRALLQGLKPDMIVHPAAIADIDFCELHPDLARTVNVDATRNLVEIARDLGAGFVYISTDGVFDGKKATPYTESDSLNPPTVYGRTKVSAEEAAATLPRHWIFRVSVLFGPGKDNFVSKCLRTVAARQKYPVAIDQLGSATYTVDAARKIMEVVAAGKYGLYHLCNEGACNRYELATRAAELAGLDPAYVDGKPAVEMHRPAPRLKYAVMEMSALKRAGFSPPRPWQDALTEYMATLR